MLLVLLVIVRPVLVDAVGRIGTHRRHLLVRSLSPRRAWLLVLFLLFGALAASRNPLVAVLVDAQKCLEQLTIFFGKLTEILRIVHHAQVLVDNRFVEFRDVNLDFITVSMQDKQLLCGHRNQSDWLTFMFPMVLKSFSQLAMGQSCFGSFSCFLLT